MPAFQCLYQQLNAEYDLDVDVLTRADLLILCREAIAPFAPGADHEWYAHALRRSLLEAYTQAGYQALGGCYDVAGLLEAIELLYVADLLPS